MIVSRFSKSLDLFFLKKNGLLLKNSGNSLKHLIARNGHGGHAKIYYREVPPPEYLNSKPALYASIFLWWWLGWHFLVDGFGGHSVEDPYLFTDEELGIPED